MVPGVWIGMPGAIDPLLSALTVAALFEAWRISSGRSWARAGVMLFLTVAVHPGGGRDTALAYLVSDGAHLVPLAVRAGNRRQGAPARDHAVFALAFAAAFCIRPQSGSANRPAVARILGAHGSCARTTRAAGERRWLLQFPARRSRSCFLERSGRRMGRRGGWDMCATASTMLNKLRFTTSGRRTRRQCRASIFRK